MTEESIPSQWQLDDTGKTQNRWQLQETDQVLPAHLQLQPETGSVAATWQPIDYQSPKPRPQRGGWVVGVLVILALIGVGAYLTWFYMGQLNQGAAQVEPAAAPSNAADAPATGGEPAVTMVITATLEPTIAPTAEPTATSTPEPTPTETPALVEMREAVVSSQYGVNARREPLASGDVVKLLENNVQALVIGGPVTDADGNEWWQIAIEPGVQGWAVGEFMTLNTRQVTVEEWVARLRALGIEPTPTPTPVVDTSTLTETVQPTDTTALPGIPDDATQTAPISVTAVISAAAGLNAREQPVATAPVMTLLPNNTSLTVTAISEDGRWLQARLPDGGSGWVALDFVQVVGNLGDLQPGPQLDSTAPLTSTASLTTTTPATTTTPITPTVVTTGTATVTFVTGVNARPSPSADAAGLRLLEWNVQAPAIGRTADNAWVQVVLADGTTAWVAASAVSVAPEIGALPIIQ